MKSTLTAMAVFSLVSAAGPSLAHAQSLSANAEPVYLGIGSQVTDEKGGQPAVGGQVEMGSLFGAGSIDASVGGVAGRPAAPTGKLDVILPLTGDDPAYQKGWYATVEGKIDSDPSHMRFTPFGMGAAYVSPAGNARFGVTALPFSLENNFNNNRLGFSSGVKIYADGNIGNIVQLYGALEGGVTYGTKGHFTTASSTSNNDYCQANDPSNCINVVKTITTQTSPGFEQAGPGSYGALEAGARLGLGDGLYVGIDGAVTETNDSGHLRNYISGDGAHATEEQTTGSVDLSLGGTFN